MKKVENIDESAKNSESNYQLTLDFDTALASEKPSIHMNNVVDMNEWNKPVATSVNAKGNFSSTTLKALRDVADSLSW